LNGEVEAISNLPRAAPSNLARTNS